MSSVEKLACDCVCVQGADGKCVCECEVPCSPNSKGKTVELTCTCKCGDNKTCVAKFTISCDCDLSGNCAGGCDEKDVFICSTKCGSCVCEFRLKKNKFCQVIKCECCEVDGSGAATTGSCCSK